MWIFKSGNYCDLTADFFFLSKKDAKLLYAMHIVAGIKEDILKFFLEIGKFSREMNSIVSWWYWMPKERKIGEMYQMNLPWQIHLLVPPLTGNVCAEEPLQLREGLQFLSSVCLGLQGAKDIKVDCQILFVHLFCSDRNTVYTFYNICSCRSIDRSKDHFCSCRQPCSTFP